MKVVIFAESSVHLGQLSAILENDDNLFLWNIVFEGPEDSLYEGGYFKAQL